ncbi:MAG TPA: lipopolysaccharide assembly protein LapA domain-containing protein [Arthrobacter sp.]|nr:lipopolysaccharide assembly protein LapA domain-containing protein [Arthrobacter sp.]
MSMDPQQNPTPQQDPRDPAEGDLVGGAVSGRPGAETTRGGVGTGAGTGTSSGTGTVAGRPEPGRAPAEDPMRVTRSGVMWTATVLALVLLVLLIIFIAQNTNTVPLQYFGMQGTVQLGLALFVAAVGGGIVVAIAGAARIIQLRSIARKGKAKARPKKR